MQDSNLFLLFIRPLNKVGIPYVVTGSVAAMIYGEPRLTHDIDLVVEMSGTHIKQLPKIFPEDTFYCPPSEVIGIEAARERRGHFNLIHFESGFKADIYLCGEDPLLIWGLAHPREMLVEGEKFRVAPPEYVIVKKLDFYREGGSTKHLTDIRAILRSMRPELDIPELERWVKLLGLKEQWELACAAKQ